MLSQLGLVGFGLFFVFLILALRRFLNASEVMGGIDANIGVKVISCSLFFGLFLVACVGNHFSVSYVWFMFALLFSVSSKVRRYV
jgi:hypothetical protein